MQTSGNNFYSVIIVEKKLGGVVGSCCKPIQGQLNTYTKERWGNNSFETKETLCFRLNLYRTKLCK